MGSWWAFHHHAEAGVYKSSPTTLFFREDAQLIASSAPPSQTVEQPIPKSSDGLGASGHMRSVNMSGHQSQAGLGQAARAAVSVETSETWRSIKAQSFPRQAHDSGLGKGSS